MTEDNDPDASPNRSDSGPYGVDREQLIEGVQEDIEPAIREIRREREQFEAFLHGIGVAGEIYDGGVPEEDFNAYVRRKWREYLDEG